MNVDFALILVIATFITGVVWLFDKFLWAPKRRKAVAGAESTLSDAERKKILHGPTVVEYCRAFFPILLIVLIIRSFIAEPFKIPSGSMKPTLLVGDFVLVNKFSYGVRLPVTNTKILSVNDPQRGEVFVFRNPESPHINMIKRVIGVSGDTVRYENKVLTINGEEVPIEFTGRGVDDTVLGDIPVMTAIENLDGVEHDVFLQPTRAAPAQEWVIPEGYYFAMGDNRDNSRDSRAWGPVPEDHLIGKAFLIWMNWHVAKDEKFWQGIGWDRIGKKIE